MPRIRLSSALTQATGDIRYASIVKGGGATVNTIANTDTGAAALDLSLGTVQDVSLTPQAFTDGVTTNASPTFTSASAVFTDADIGRSVSGTNIPAGTTIIARASATSVTLSKNATASGSALAWTLNRNIVLTVTNPSASGKLTDWVLIVRQDATGGRYVTFPAAFANTPALDAAAVAASAVSYWRVISVNGGTAWLVMPMEAFSGVASDLLLSGEESMPRETVTTTAATVSQDLRLTFFTARKTEDITQLTLISSTAAGATPTLVRWGVYWESPITGDLVLLAAIANDTTLFAAANTVYTRSLTATWHKVKGQRYVIGDLIVTAAGMPIMMGNTSLGALGTDDALAPRMAGRVTGQSDLPANILASSLAISGIYRYVRMQP